VNVRVGEIGVVGNEIARGLGLGAREARDQRARHLTFARRLVDRGGAQRIGLDADLGEQHQAARTCTRKHEAWLQIRAPSLRLVACALTAQRLALRCEAAAEQ
jgi:hypothetical protein